MDVALVYLHVVNRSCPLAPPPSFYHEYAVRFAWTYRTIKHGYPHKLIVVACGGKMDDFGRELFEPLGASFMQYVGSGWDVGAHQFVSRSLDYDFVIYCGTVVKLISDGWMLKLVEAREKYGNGLYGPQASYEINPHIRSLCFGTSPLLLSEYPHVINSRLNAVRFESGDIGNLDWSWSYWVLAKGMPVLMVAADGVYELPDWRKPENVFRKGDQSNLITWDRHNTIYRDSVHSEKRRLELAADGL